MEAKILLVDGNLEARDIKHTLESFGYAVSCASSGEEAIEKVFDTRPDLVLMDINLTGEMNGIEVAQKIQETDIPVVFSTAHSNQPLIKMVMETQPTVTWSSHMRQLNSN